MLVMSVEDLTLVAHQPLATHMYVLNVKKKQIENLASCIVALNTDFFFFFFADVLRLDQLVPLPAAEATIKMEQGR